METLIKLFCGSIYTIFFKIVIIHLGPLTIDHHFEPHLRPTNRGLETIIPPLTSSIGIYNLHAHLNSTLILTKTCVTPSERTIRRSSRRSSMKNDGRRLSFTFQTIDYFMISQENVEYPIFRSFYTK